MRGKVFSPTYTRCRWLLVVLCLTPLTVWADQGAGSEYTLKAALLFKLTKFVSWPAKEAEEVVNAEQDHDVEGDDAAPIQPDPAFNLCVVGADPFGAALDPLSERQVGQRLIALHRIAATDPVAHCQLVFVNEFRGDRLTSVLNRINNMPILTVSDIDGFAELGGMIEITRQRKRLGFRINISAVRAAGLTIAAPLLELATVVGQNEQ